MNAAVVFSCPAGCPARRVAEAKASPALLAQRHVFLNHTGLGPWGYVESGGTLVLGSFWAVLGHLLEGRVGTTSCLALLESYKDEAWSKRRRVPAC